MLWWIIFDKRRHSDINEVSDLRIELSIFLLTPGFGEVWIEDSKDSLPGYRHAYTCYTLRILCFGLVT